MRSLARTGAVLAATGALLVAGPGAAFAHECFVVNRSTQGALGAAHSGKWFALPRDVLVADLPGMLGGASDAQIACAVDYAEQNLPEMVAIGSGPAKGTDYVIAENMNPANQANGKGIDHLEDVFGALLTACGITPPAAG